MYVPKGLTIIHTNDLLPVNRFLLLITLLPLLFCMPVKRRSRVLFSVLSLRVWETRKRQRLVGPSRSCDYHRLIAQFGSCMDYKCQTADENLQTRLLLQRRLNPPDIMSPNEWPLPRWKSLPRQHVVLDKSVNRWQSTAVDFIRFSMSTVREGDFTGWDRVRWVFFGCKLSFLLAGLYICPVIIHCPRTMHGSHRSLSANFSDAFAWLEIYFLVHNITTTTLRNWHRRDINTTTSRFVSLKDEATDDNRISIF